MATRSARNNTLFRKGSSMSETDDFTYSGYNNLIELLLENDYTFSTYDNYNLNQYSVIMRHDVDYCLSKAGKLSEFEAFLSSKLKKKITSTFFLMLSTDFYNVFSLNGQRIVDCIMGSGHEIGLHFDELRYPDSIGNVAKIRDRICFEAETLSRAVKHPITSVSMHRPSMSIINADLKIPGIINTYSKEFFEGCKYLSDSRRRWREPITEIIKSKRFSNLHILTHPFWYGEYELSISDTIIQFIDEAKKERYETLDDNITGLSEIVGKSHVANLPS